MRRGIGAFFDGFNQAYDSVGRVVQDYDLGKVADAKAQTSDGFTAADGEQLAAMANARDENGNPYYTFQPGENGGYRVKNNFQVGGAQAPDVALAPRRVTDFMGQRYDGELSESQIANARMRAMADVVASNDPVAGLRLRQQALQGERDDQRFQRETQESDYRLAGLRRADAQGQRLEDIQRLTDEVGQFTPDQLHAYASKANVAPGGQVPLLYTGKTKDGYQFVTIDPASGAPAKPLTLDEAQTRQLATAARLLEAGYGAEGTQMMAGVSKELNEIVAHLNGVASQTTTSQNNALRLGNEDGFRRQQLGIQAGEAARRGRLTDLQIKEIETARDNNVKARELLGQIQALTPEEQMSPKGQALIRQFNVLNSKPGEQLNLGLQGRGGAGAGARGPVVDQKKNDDGTYTAFRKDTGEAVYNTVNGLKIPLGMTSDEFAKLRTEASQLGVAMEGSFDENGQYQFGFKGRDGNYYTTPREAAMAKTAAKSSTPPGAAAAGMPAPRAAQRQVGLSLAPNPALQRSWEQPPAPPRKSISDQMEPFRRAARESADQGFNPYRQNTVR